MTGIIRYFCPLVDQGNAIGDEFELHTVSGHHYPKPRNCVFHDGGFVVLWNLSTGEINSSITSTDVLGGHLITQEFQNPKFFRLNKF